MIYSEFLDPFYTCVFYIIYQRQLFHKIFQLTIVDFIMRFYNMVSCFFFPSSYSSQYDEGIDEKKIGVCAPASTR